MRGGRWKMLIISFFYTNQKCACANKFYNKEKKIKKDI